MIRPLSDRLLVLPDLAEETFAAAPSILRPDIARERPCEGTVLALGPALLGSQLQDGTKILYGKFAGSEVVVDNIECLLMQIDEVMGIVTPGEQPGIPEERKERQKRLDGAQAGGQLVPMTEAGGIPVHVDANMPSDAIRMESAEERIRRLRELAQPAPVEEEPTVQQAPLDASAIDRQNTRPVDELQGSSSDDFPF